MENCKVKKIRTGSMHWYLTNKPRYGNGKNWYQLGVYTSKLGMCFVYREHIGIRIETVYSGQEYIRKVEGYFTDKSIAVKCGKFLKEINIL